MPEKSPLFSICIPNYNYAEYLGETIDSVLNQTFQDFEIVIQDNASTDSSWELIKSYATKDERIRVFRNNYNVGFAPNLQKVTSNAQGDFFILLSSDDIMFPNALEAYHNVINQQDNDKLVIGANTAIIDENSNVYGQITMSDNNWRLDKTFEKPNMTEAYGFKSIKGHDFLKDFVNKKSAFKAVGVFCATCYSRKLWEEVEGYDTAVFFSPDTNFMVKMLLKNPTYIWQNEFLFGYRVHSANNYGSLQKFYTLKNVTDKYIRTLHYGNEELELMNTSRHELQSLFVEVICLKQAFQSWIRGNFFKSMQLHAYSIASYPKKALKAPLFYLMLVLNSVGLIFIPFLKLSIKLFREYSR